MQGFETLAVMPNDHYHLHLPDMLAVVASVQPNPLITSDILSEQFRFKTMQLHRLSHHHTGTTLRVPASPAVNLLLLRSASRSNTKDLCIRMLVEAHPIAFTEFFNLTNDATHHGLDLYGDDQLLHLAQRCLTQAEEGERANNLVSAFDARCTLAEAFAVRHAMQLALQQRLHALEIAKRMTDNSIVCQASLAAAELCEQCGMLVVGYSTARLMELL
jgi:hypothetical protein